MTDKEIINNGVNVRDCACIIEDYYYQQANNLANGYKHIKNVCELGERGAECYRLFCKDNPNCYYKQLKRKEKECEKYKKKFSRFFNIDNQECWDIAFLNNKKAKYKQALDEIEKYLDTQQKYFDGEDYRNLLDIINEAKGEINEES